MTQTPIKIGMPICWSESLHAQMTASGPRSCGAHLLVLHYAEKIYRLKLFHQVQPRAHGQAHVKQHNCTARAAGQSCRDGKGKKASQTTADLCCAEVSCEAMRCAPGRPSPPPPAHLTLAVYVEHGEHADERVLAALVQLRDADLRNVGHYVAVRQDHALWQPCRPRAASGGGKSLPLTLNIWPVT
jgi:hypothetical protein